MVIALELELIIFPRIPLIHQIMNKMLNHKLSIVYVQTIVLEAKPLKQLENRKTWARWKFLNFNKELEDDQSANWNPIQKRASEDHHEVQNNRPSSVSEKFKPI